MEDAVSDGGGNSGSGGCVGGKTRAETSGRSRVWQSPGGSVAMSGNVWQAVADLPPLEPEPATVSVSVSVQCQGPGSEVCCLLLSVSLTLNNYCHHSNLKVRQT